MGEITLMTKISDNNLLRMSIKVKFGLFAIVCSIISIGLVSIGNNMLSDYHCDSPAWLSQHDYTGGYLPNLDIHVSGKVICLQKTNTISAVFFNFGLMLPWAIFSVAVAVWRTSIKSDRYDKMPVNTKLCEIDLHQKIYDYLNDEKFKLRYADNLGKCDLCKGEAIAEFIKVPSNDTIQKESTK